MLRVLLLSRFWLSGSSVQLLLGKNRNETGVAVPPRFIFSDPLFFSWAAPRGGGVPPTGINIDLCPPRPCVPLPHCPNLSARRILEPVSGHGWEQKRSVGRPVPPGLMDKKCRYGCRGGFPEPLLGPNLLHPAEKASARARLFLFRVAAAGSVSFFPPLPGGLDRRFPALGEGRLPAFQPGD